MGIPKSEGFWPKQWTVQRTDPVTYDRLKRCQARAEDAGLHGDALREVLAMLCQEPRENLYSAQERRVL